MLKGKFVLGILCLFGAVYLYAEINAMFSFPQLVLNTIMDQFITIGFSNAPTQSHLYSKSEILKSVQACNTSGGDLGGLGDYRTVCLAMQSYYYSPWILGIVGILAIIYGRPHYYGSRIRRYS